VINNVYCVPSHTAEPQAAVVTVEALSGGVQLGGESADVLVGHGQPPGRLLQVPLQAPPLAPLLGHLLPVELWQRWDNTITSPAEAAGPGGRPDVQVNTATSCR